MDEAELVRRVRDGDAEAFRALVERHQDRVFHLVSSVLGPFARGEAEEVTQEVFLRVFRSLDRFRGDSGLGTWLHRIAYNEAVEARGRARLRLPHVSSDELAGRAGADDPEAAARQASDARQVWKAVEQLPDLYRTLVHLYYWQELPLAEIASLTGLKEGTVKSYLARARERIGRVLSA